MTTYHLGHIGKKIAHISYFLFQSCSKRKRSAGLKQLTNTDDRVFSTSKMLHILPGASSATTTLGKALISILTCQHAVSGHYRPANKTPFRCRFAGGR